MAQKSESMLDILAKGTTAFIKAKTQQRKAQLDMQSKMALKDIEQKQNFMQRIAEREYQTPYQRMLMEQYRRQRGAPAGDVFAPGPAQRRRVELGPKGPAVKTVGMKEAIYGNIMRKPEGQRTEKERAFVNKYLYGKAAPEAIKEFDPTMTEQVFARLLEPKKSPEDFEADLADLRKYRKTYEDMGVDVISILRRAYTTTKETQPEKAKGFAGILEWFKERF